jgi:hypothetical protein
MRRTIRAWSPLGRHSIRPKLSDDFFPERRIVRHVVHIGAVENDAGSRCSCRRFAVVAGDTVSIHRRANRRGII